MKASSPFDVPESALLRFSVEDRFIILHLWEPKTLLPTSKIGAALAHILGFFTPSYSLVCDVRSAETLTADMIELLCELQTFNPIVLASKADARRIENQLNHTEARWASAKVLALRHSPPKLKLFNFPPLPAPSGLNSEPDKFAHPQWWEAIKKVDKRSPPSFEEYDIVKKLYLRLHFEDDVDDDDRSLEPYVNCFENWRSPTKGATVLEMGGYAEIVYAIRWLAMTIPLVARNSLLTQFAIEMGGADALVVAPYHGHATYDIETPGGLLLGRPSVIAKKTQALFSSEIEEFTAVLTSRPKELDIQRFLERHPNILRSLGYLRVYPQVVLARDDDTSLRPDFMLQPLGDEWCDILDIKLPDNRLVVGGRDRKTLAACIHELAAQLREYAAYFENPIYARRVAEKYGIKCYRPRLIGVIGRDEVLADERQIRRLMTAYDDIGLLTFDRMIAIAKSRLLI